MLVRYQVLPAPECKKLVGNGLYIKKGGCVCEVETDGRGLYLEPASDKGFSKLGDGLYLKKEGKIYDGKGFIARF